MYHIYSHKNLIGRVRVLGITYVAPKKTDSRTLLWKLKLDLVGCVDTWVSDMYFDSKCIAKLCWNPFSSSQVLVKFRSLNKSHILDLEMSSLQLIMIVICLVAMFGIPWAVLGDIRCQHNYRLYSLTRWLLEMSSLQLIMLVIYLMAVFGIPWLVLGDIRFQHNYRLYCSNEVAAG